MFKQDSNKTQKKPPFAKAAFLYIKYPLFNDYFAGSVDGFDYIKTLRDCNRSNS
jgi:hypothetical protein